MVFHFLIFSQYKRQMFTECILLIKKSNDFTLGSFNQGPQSIGSSSQRLELIESINNAFQESLEADIKKAMLAKDKEVLKALRAIKSMILLAETEKGSSGEISEDAGNKILMKAAKQRKDSAEIYKEQNREDLYAVEMAELAVIEKYLPQQLSVEEVTEKLKEIIAQVGASGPQDMGKVMGMATKALAGQSDGKTISGIVRQLLTQ